MSRMSFRKRPCDQLIEVSLTRASRKKTSDVIVNYLYFKIVLLLLLITFEVNESLAVILSIQICSRRYRFYSTVD